MKSPQVHNRFLKKLTEKKIKFHLQDHIWIN